MRSNPPDLTSLLDTPAAFFYRPGVIGLLRFVGIVNAAAWLGATVFLLGWVEPAAYSQEMQALFGPKSFPYFSAAVALLLSLRYSHLCLACGVVALLHLMAEWLYLGKYPHRVWVLLVFSLFSIGVAQTFWLQPRLSEWHRLEFTRPDQREAANRAYRTWHTFSQGLNLALLGGLLCYIWRVANPTEPTRFLSTKFRS